MAGVFKKFSDIHVTIEDLIVEGDKAVVRNTWTATDPDSGMKLQMSGIVNKVLSQVAGRRLTYANLTDVGAATSH